VDTEYREEEIAKLLASYLTSQGFDVQMEKVIDSRIRWRPPIFAKRDQQNVAIDIRLNDSITDFWLKTYKKAYEVLPEIKIFVAIPEDVKIPFTLGRKLEENNVGIIMVSYEEINYLLELCRP